MTKPKPADDLTRQRQKAQMALVIEALQLGCYLHTAAQRAGISDRTLDIWIAKGKKETEGFFRDFYAATEKATADCEFRVVASLLSAGKSDPHWFAWWLERRCGKRWRIPKEEPVTPPASEGQSSTVRYPLRGAISEQDHSDAAAALEAHAGK